MRLQKRKLTLESSVGAIEIQTDYGQQSGGGEWICPQRKFWGIGAHEKMTPALQDRLCFTTTMTTSYESAAQVANKWGCVVDDSKLHALAQRVGARAEQKTEQRIKTAVPEREPQRKPSELGVLLVDGWLVRHRGPGWGIKKTEKTRVEWHEMKMGVYYQIEQASLKENGRVELADKVVVSTLGEALELGQRLNWEAMRAGLGRARNLEMLADGSEWIWNLKKNRWKDAVEVLDFFHASEHLWALGRTLKGEERAKDWVEPLLHQLRHGKEKKALKQIADLPVSKAEHAEVIRREQGYFANKAHQMKYKQIADRGWPIGSGAVESACRQRQGRFKGRGQFWSAKGLRNLCALEQARHNHHWEELWETKS